MRGEGLGVGDWEFGVEAGASFGHTAVVHVRLQATHGCPCPSEL